MKCPKCLGELEFKESTFEQYQPSVYYCANCREEFHQLEVKGFNQGLERKAE